MDKSLKEWTLGEVQALCVGRNCKGCPMVRDGICAVVESPNSWNLVDAPKYTDDEIALAKLLMKAGVEAVQKDGKIILIDYETRGGVHRSTLPGDAFPSLPADMDNRLALKDIAESEATP